MKNCAVLSFVIGLIFVLSTGCSLTKKMSSEHIGAAVGAGTGAAAGAILAGDDDTATGALIGGLAGGALGYFVGSKLTEKDQERIQSVLENTPAGRTESWTSKEGVAYSVTPGKKYTQGGKVYRNFDIEAGLPDGEVRSGSKVAYKRKGGRKWHIAGSDSK